MANATQFTNGGGFKNVLEYTVSDTFIIPSYVKAYGFEVIGGGGGGGRPSSAGSLGGGGGGGATYVAGVRSCKGGEALTLTVGTAGVGAIVNNTNGTDGGDTFIKMDGQVICQSLGGAGSSNPGGAGFGVATGSKADTMIRGGNGVADGAGTSTFNSAIFATDYLNAATERFTLSDTGTQGADSGGDQGGGAGGSSYFAIGGNGGDANTGGTATAGTDGGGFGAGGGGGGAASGGTTGNGGNGGSGVIRIYY